MGKLIVRVALLVLALVLGFAAAHCYGGILAVTVVASLGATHFFWTARRTGRRMLNSAALAGVAAATLNVAQALLRLLFEFRPTDLLR
jgi:hypothetical protein